MERIIDSEKYGKIKLLIDKQDLPIFESRTWFASFNQREFRITAWGGRGKTVYLSREIMGNPVGCVVDHINGNPLDNRRSNLRICKEKENLLNRRTYKTNTAGLKGVSWHKRVKKFQAQIQVYGKKICLGYYKDIQTAARAYNEAAKKYHGEFARLNEIKEVTE